MAGRLSWDYHEKRPQFALIRGVFKGGAILISVIVVTVTHERSSDHWAPSRTQGPPETGQSPGLP